MSVIRKPKLELTWIGKDVRPKLEPRILLEDPEKSYHAKFRVKMMARGDAEGAERDKNQRSFSANSAPPRENLNCFDHPSIVPERADSDGARLFQSSLILTIFRVFHRHYGPRFL